MLSSFLLGGPSGSGVGDDGDDRHRRLADDGEGRLHQERRRRASRGRRARRHLVAAGARRGRLPHRRVPEDLLPRRDLDGDHPDLLYYLALLVMVELDAKRFGAKGVEFHQEMTLGQMTRRYGFHFMSLLSVVVFMVIGYSPTLSVFYATADTFALSFLRRETALVSFGPALRRGGRLGKGSALMPRSSCAPWPTARSAPSMPPPPAPAPASSSASSPSPGSGSSSHRS